MWLSFAYRRRMKKPSAYMKMKILKVMKMRTNMKILKKPAGCQTRMQTCRKAKLEEKKQIAERNARARARKAARLNKSYTPRTNVVGLQSIAAQAHAAEMIARASHEAAEGALSEAAEAKSVAASSKEVSDAAHSIAVGAAQRVLNIQAQLSEGKESLRKTQEQLSEGKEALRKTHALAEKNAERLNTDDRRRGYCTPVHKSVR
jgi:hypothetical protein